MLDKQTSIKTAKKFIKELKALGYNPKEAWLFGSVVSGNTHEYSDIDLALWDKKFTGVSFIDVEKIKSVLRKYILIELHPYQEGTTEKENPFIGEIKKMGERIL